MRTVGGRSTRLAVGVLGGIVVVLGLAQLALPKIAAHVARDQIGKYGTVKSVSVSAFPAIELLWGHAETAGVRAGSLRIDSLSKATELLSRSRGIDRMEMSAESLRIGPLRMRDARIEKRGDTVYTQGSVELSDLRGVLPNGIEVQPVASGGGRVEVRASGNLFGVPTSVDAVVGPWEGKLVAQPRGVPFASFVRITLYSDPRMLVRGVDLRPGGGAQEDGVASGSYRLKMWMQLR